MQRSRPGVGLGPTLGRGCRVSAVLEYPGHLHMTPLGRPMQWCRSVLLLRCHVGAVLDEDPYDFTMTLL